MSAGLGPVAAIAAVDKMLGAGAEVIESEEEARMRRAQENQAAFEAFLRGLPDADRRASHLG